MRALQYSALYCRRCGSCAAMCSFVIDTDTIRDAMHFSVIHGVRTRELNGNLIY